jgi:molybdopterin-synthase adenylyltransferase
MEQDRYSRQRLFVGIGEEGQRRLGASHVALVGCGADGSVIADRLVRVGVGHLTIIDGDRVELSNLRRQALYDEEDAAVHRLKAAAAVDKLRRMNSEVMLTPVIEMLRGDNAEALLADADLDDGFGRSGG